MKLSDYVFHYLASLGVRHVFMLPGGGAMHLVDSLGHCEGIEPVGNLHEQASAIAAEAYARVTNNLGVALVTTGPGGTNAITGVAAAWQDSTPCLFISGQVKRADISGNSGVRQLGVQEIDIVSLVKAITKYAVTVTDPAMVRYHLEKAVHSAKTGRPGPVWLDIPLDVQVAHVDPKDLKGYEPAENQKASDDRFKEDLVASFIELFKKAERPVILAGNGIRLAGAQGDFLKFIDALGVPVLTTRLGVDLISSEHDLHFGMPGMIASRSANFTLQNSDLLLILGARLDMALIAYAPDKLARGAKKVMVNIDPAEINKIGPSIDLPIVMDAGLFMHRVLARKGTLQARDCSTWIDRCRVWKERYPFVLPEHHAEVEKVSVYAFSDILSRELTSDYVILPGNAGNACEIFLTAFKVKAGQRVFHNKGTGAMGFAQPAAIGACLASGNRPTVCIDGDGGFQLNIQELETIRRLNLPIKFFVMNNDGYASIRVSQRGCFERVTVADKSSGLTLPDLSKVVGAYGIATVRITDQKDLKQKIRQVLDMQGPVVCDVMIIPDEVRAPRVMSFHHADGTIVSKPLEDMSPLLEREEFYSNMIVKHLDY
ncbi:MAG: thiamine pyrophosphate-binding protein [Candidatus Omnitrophica bacterium]|nr:thiamine pyrophosphate-binding protein [Candidatus Omnitrophota bacterium]